MRMDDQSKNSNLPIGWTTKKADMLAGDNASAVEGDTDEATVSEVVNMVDNMEVTAADRSDDEELEYDDLQEVVFNPDDDCEPSGEEDGDDEMESETIPEINRIEDNATAIFSGHQDSVYCIDLGPGAELAISGDGDNTAFIWKVSDGSTLHKLTGHTDSVVDCGFNMDGSIVATASYDSTVRTWDVGTGAFRYLLSGPSTEIEFMQWHKKANIILAGSQDSTAWVWNANTGECISVLAGHTDSVTCGCFTPNGKRALTGSLDKSIRLWDPKSSSCLHVFSGHQWATTPTLSIACSSSKRLVAVGGLHGTLRVVSLESKRVVYSVDPENPNEFALDDMYSVESVDFCETHPFLLCASTDGFVRIYDMSSSTCRFQCEHVNSAITKAEFLPGSPLFVSACEDGMTRLWDARNGSCLRIITSHEALVTGFSIGDGVIASVSDDRKCRVNTI